MQPDRLTGFATDGMSDSYRLDANGFPFDQTHADAMTFLKENNDEPFFLYYATWLVHAPLVMRSEALLRKYEAKLGVTLTAEHAETWKLDGQTNPFYCAMVEQLDYYLGGLFEYLETTEDPRWPGHKLVENPQDAALIRTAEGAVRDTMLWHFPNSAALESSIRIGDYKLVRNYKHLAPDVSELELYRLYDSESGEQVRVDIEEAYNLAAAMPEKARMMNQKLTSLLTEMEASYPYWNPKSSDPLPHQDAVCEVLSAQQYGNEVVVSYRENGAKLVGANLIYSLNGGEPFEEWFRQPAQLMSGEKVSAQLPKGTTHYFINLIDENNFLISHPEIDEVKRTKEKHPYSALALPCVQ